jgi:adenomatosis polyposis coli protein
VLRNLSWRADSSSKEALQQANVVRALITVSMETHRESTLKSMLSALWNLSAHSSQNKADICATPGALEFLVKTLLYKSESKTLSVVESGGGILRNVSSHIATREDYR